MRSSVSHSIAEMGQNMGETHLFFWEAQGGSLGVQIAAGSQQNSVWGESPPLHPWGCWCGSCLSVAQTTCQTLLLACNPEQWRREAFVFLFANHDCRPDSGVCGLSQEFILRKTRWLKGIVSDLLDDDQLTSYLR